MQNRFIKRKHIGVAIILALSLNYIYSQDCSDGYTYFSELPESCTINDGNHCLSNLDLTALNDIINDNSLEYSSPIHVGTQTWNDGRLKILTGTYNPSGSYGINAQLQTLPESFGNLTGLTTLFLEWHSLTSLPSSFSQLTNLITLVINNNWLTSIPDDIGDISNLFVLDLGYNQLASIPESVCDINFTNTSYLYLFNNNLTSLPDCLCGLDLNWNGLDGAFLPYFAVGGNQLCGSFPQCIAEATYFESALDPIYYSAIIDAFQDVPALGNMNGDTDDQGNDTFNVLDVVMLANCVLAGDCGDLQGACSADVNGDDNYNVLDIVQLANCVLAQNCSG